MDCPKCGYPDATGAECPRCGVIFAKLRPEISAPLPPVPPSPTPPPLAPSASVPAPFQPVARIDLGSCLGDVFRVYFGNFTAFFLLTLLVCLPNFGLLALQFQPSVKEPGALAIWTGATLIVNLLCQAIAAAALTYGVLQHLRRKRASVGDCLKEASRIILPILGVSLLQGLLVGLGVIACIVPGLIAIAAFGVAIPAAVEERLGVVAALQRSVDLTRGNRWLIFVIFAAIGLLAMAVFLGLAFAYGLVLASRGTVAPDSSTLVFSLFTELVGVIPTGLSATASAVLYYRLRGAKESIDVRDLASVFD